MVRIARGFERRLRSYHLEDLEAHSGVIYGVWGNFVLAYLNPAWHQFANENGGESRITSEWDIGRSILDGMSGSLKQFYEKKFRACLNNHTVWAYEYECSSDVLYRRYHQIVYPLGQKEGLLFTNILVTEKPHNAKLMPPQLPDKAVYVDKNGMISQYSYCRRVKSIRGAEHWDWIPGWAKKNPANTTHTFCLTCFGYYFPLTG